MAAIRDVTPLVRPAILPGTANLAGRVVSALVPSVLTACLLVAAVLPIGALLARSLFDRAGSFVGIRNFVRYSTEPGLSIAAWNSVALSTMATVIVVFIAFPVAYALARSRIPQRGLLRVVVMLPLLTPSLLPAFGLVYLFGNQGLLKSWLFGAPLYGPVGIVMGSVFYALPHAVLILSAGLAAGDARLYEAAQALKAGPWRTFRTVTLPSCRYALVSAASVVFVLVFTDFGIPTVLGGSTNVLATDIYKLVIGRFDFELGAVVGVLLLLPAVIAFGVDALVRRTERMHITGRSVPIEPRPSLRRDTLLLVFAIGIAGAILGLIGTAIFGSLVRFWPYNLTLGLHNYARLLDDADDVRALINSLVLAACVATLGTVMVACTGWVIARRIGPKPVQQTLHAVAMVPVAVPGLVLGLGYVFFFNNPHNPLHGLQGTMALIVICTVTHFYTVPHLMTVGGLSRLDREVDLAGQALRSGPLGTARRIHVSFLAPTLVDVAGYFFVNAMTTVSALIFLFTAKTRVAAIAVVNMVEGSRFGQAAALAVLIMVMSIAATVVQIGVRAAILRAQGWRRRGAA